MKGFALDTTRAAQGMPRRVENAKIALLDFNLRKHRMALGVQILVRDPKKLEQIRQREADITKEKIMKIINAGANVILTTKVCFCRLNLGSVVALTIVVCDILLVFPSLGLAGCVCLSIPQGIDDLCMKYLVENGVIGVRRVKKDDLQRVASATGGVLLPNLSDLEGEESFDPACLGEAAEVSEERVGDGEMLFIRGCKTARATTYVACCSTPWSLYASIVAGLFCHPAFCCVVPTSSCWRRWSVVCMIVCVWSSACLKASRLLQAVAQLRLPSVCTLMRLQPPWAPGSNWPSRSLLRLCWSFPRPLP